MEIAIMIEGQNGLNWSRWQRIAHAVEELGFVGLYRSDHFTNPTPPDMDSLELWVSLTWLASHTQRIEFGPLVTPASFRHPVFTARMAKDVANLSGGRLMLGLGAGWQQREHDMFGFELLDPSRRFDRFEEAVEVVARLLGNHEPINFEGEFYRLEEAILLPRPRQPGGPSILIGGNGLKRTLPLAARYADEWNAVFVTATRFAELNARMDELLEKLSRRPIDLRRSLMTGLVIGQDRLEVQGKAVQRGSTERELRGQGLIVGTPSEIVDQLGELAEAGVQRVMLQWLELDNLDELEMLAQAVLH
jgi:F420-dependent oxidoreductase-like protein